MEDDFYASLKLISGEEIFSKVSVCDEDNRTMLILAYPVILEEIKYSTPKELDAFQNIYDRKLLTSVNKILN